MRIVSGQYKGRRITAPKKLPTRPTTDMAKEALFNILNNKFYFDEITVLDLFAGTGNISYEFASRGTTNITCVDEDNGCIQFINETASNLEMPLQAIKSDVFAFLQKTIQKSDVIFADPPYEFSLEDFTKLPEIIFKKDLLEEDGVLIIEHSKHTKLSDIENFSYSKSYGGNMFSFFEVKNNQNV
ncbi:MAG: RsmD family RNA methyltransferase [Xanthomarina sp.]